MRDEELTLDYCKGAGWWLDVDRVNSANCCRLIRLCLISCDHFPVVHDTIGYHQLNSDGCNIIDDVDYEPLIVTELKKTNSEEAVSLIIGVRPRG
jgi:hypothetical protein